MVAEFARQQALASNLANANSTGYKRDDIFLRSFRDLGVPLSARATSLMPVSTLWGSPRTSAQVGSGVLIDEIRPNLSQGGFRETGRPLDLGIQGPGFFAVQDTRGTLYTRNGSFARNADGFLTTSDGKLVLGLGGPIQMNDSAIAVGDDGRIFGGGGLLGQLRLTDFDRPEGLTKLENGLFADNGAAPRDAQGALVKQGYLEESNINLVRGMTEVLSVMRSYQASQRVLQHQDETLRLAVGELGRLG